MSAFTRDSRQVLFDGEPVGSPLRSGEEAQRVVEWLNMGAFHDMVEVGRRNGGGRASGRGSGDAKSGTLGEGLRAAPDPSTSRGDET